MFNNNALPLTADGRLKLSADTDSPIDVHVDGGLAIDATGGVAVDISFANEQTMTGSTPGNGANESVELAPQLTLALLGDNKAFRLEIDTIVAGVDSVAGDVARTIITNKVVVRTTKIAEVIGTADITAGALYGVGGTLDGTHLDLNINGQGVSALALNGAGNTATKATFLAAIIAKAAWAGVGAQQQVGTNKLDLRAGVSIAVDAGSTCLVALGLVAGNTLVGGAPVLTIANAGATAADGDAATALYTNVLSVAAAPDRLALTFATGAGITAACKVSSDVSWQEISY